MTVVAQEGSGYRRLSFLHLLLVATLAYLIVRATQYAGILFESDGYLHGPGRPFGGDYVNLWSAARLVLSGGFETIYRPDAFAAFERSFVGENIGFRLWAYPPHVLVLIWPFALGGYHAMFVVWTLLGLGVLAAGARRFGFTWVETAILTLSPASLQCIAAGQSGSIATGLMLFAFAGTSLKTPSSAVAAALLTVKPQTGFLIPVLWLMHRRWGLIAATALLAALLITISVIVFGRQTWAEYLTVTLPALSAFEQTGEGPFLYMIPSLFIALRLLGVEGATVSSIHIAFAAAVLLVLLWRLRRTTAGHQQVALIMIATCLITPYLHNYDLGLLLAGALIALRSRGQGAAGETISTLGVAIAWVLPIVIAPLGQSGLPISPLLILFVFTAAALGSARPSTA